MAADELTQLDAHQREVVDRWFPGAIIVANHSWGLVATAVVQLNHAGGDVIVKAFGPTNGHFERELMAHEEGVVASAFGDRGPELLGADRDARVLATRYLPGHLVEGSPAETDPAAYRQAGELLARMHAVGARTDETYDDRQHARALAWLDGPHRIPPDVERHLRERLDQRTGGPVTVVPTHGDWQPRNWLIDGDVVKVIDFGRFDWRPPETDLARLSVKQFAADPGLEAAFLQGYGADPRDPRGWWLAQLREAIGTACWAHQVGDTDFEALGQTMIADALAAPIPH